MNKKGFTPLEKFIDFKRRLSPLEADGGIKPLSGHSVSPVRDKSLNGVRKRSSLTGFTLVEIIIATMIMVVAITGTLQIFCNLMNVSENNDNFVPAMNEIQGKMDEIRNVPFDDIAAKYNNTNFSVDILTNRGVTHSGLISVAVLEPDFLLEVRAVICWRQRNRVIGEDTNLNGVLDAGEDKNNNGQMDSPCALSTAILFR